MKVVPKARPRSRSTQRPKASLNFGPKPFTAVPVRKLIWPCLGGRAMASIRHAMRPALYVLCVAVILLGTVDRASYSQGQIFQNIITDIIRRQQELKERRREEVAATQRLQ